MASGKRVLIVAVALVMGWISPCLAAQVPVVHPRHPNEPPSPTVTFDFAFRGASPSHYAISVDARGEAAYTSDQEATPEKPAGDPYIVEFTVSEPIANQIFEAAKAVNFFKGNFNYTKGRIANTGTKTLGYKYQDVDNTTTYNYSDNLQIQELTKLFQSLSQTLEYGQKLTYLHRFDKLGLDAELKLMLDAAQHGELAELQADRAILEQIVADTSVMNIARQRAEKLLVKASSPPITAPETGGAPRQR